MADYYHIDIGVNFSGHKYTTKIIEQALQQFYDNYGESVISISNCVGEIGKNKTLADTKFACSVNYTAGCHPHHASEMTLESQYQTILEHAINDPKCLCIGEIGLDFNRDYSPRPKQIEVFERQIAIAKQLGKPMYLHCRDAFPELLQCLKKFGYYDGVVHCFTGDDAQAKEFIKLGFKLGITGWLLDKRRNADLVLAVTNAPLESLMVETDAPFMALKGQKTSVPSNVSQIIKEIARLKGLDEQVCGKTIYQTTKSFFSI
jgi:TatD DNase family protein